MLIKMAAPDEWEGKTLAEVFEENNCLNLREKMDVALEEIKKMPINGCITGSIWLEGYNPEAWSDTPDIDVFVFSEGDLREAMTFAQYALGMTPGTGTERSMLQEKTKINILRKSGLNKKIGISTFKYHESGVTLNITYKMTKINGRWEPLRTTYDVLSSFDMSIVMQGYDIKRHVFMDLRMGCEPVAYPNPLRDNDCTTWTISKWIRQFDRVVKYYDRGFDTRPMAKFYIDMIDECLAIGSIFDSENSKQKFEDCVPEFVEKRAAMAEWLKEHEDD